MISQVLEIPPRRRERAMVSYLTPEETDALLAAPRPGLVVNPSDDLALPAVGQ